VNFAGILPFFQVEKRKEKSICARRQELETVSPKFRFGRSDFRPMRGRWSRQSETEAAERFSPAGESTLVPNE
jgi:hypothetical protein